MAILEKMLKKLRSFDNVDLDLYIPEIRNVVGLRLLQSRIQYLVIEDFFTQEYAEEMKRAFDIELKNRGLAKANDKEKFSKMFNYDAYNYTPFPDIEGPFRVFFSREWYELFEKIFGRKFDENVMTTLHHHEINSETGYVHNDFGIYAFRQRPFINKLNHWYYNSNYQTHKPGDDVSKQENVEFTRRSVALIYYMNGDGWHEGDGGETGFFNEKKDVRPFVKIAPKPNRLLVFKINQNSYHAFIKNIKYPRNTIIQWFHEPFEMPTNIKKV